MDEGQLATSAETQQSPQSVTLPGFLQVQPQPLDELTGGGKAQRCRKPCPKSLAVEPADLIFLCEARDLPSPHGDMF